MKGLDEASNAEMYREEISNATEFLRARVRVLESELEWQRRIMQLIEVVAEDHPYTMSFTITVTARDMIRGKTWKEAVEMSKESLRIAE